MIYSALWTCITFANELLFSMLFKSLKQGLIKYIKRTLLLQALLCSWNNHRHHLVHKFGKKGYTFLLCLFEDVYLHRYSLFFHSDLRICWRVVLVTWILFDTYRHSSTTETICVWVSHMCFGCVSFILEMAWDKKCSSQILRGLSK